MKSQKNNLLSFISREILLIKRLVLFCSLLAISPCQKTETQDSQWENLLDEKLSKWEVFLGIPHKSSGIPGYENVEDVRKGKPLGLGNLRNVYAVMIENGEPVLKITGEIFGSLATKSEYENYHLTFDVKWGEKRWEPRLEKLRNNGVLYHSIGEHGSGLWNTWMSSLEFEVEETNFGDFITINDSYVRAKCPASKREDGEYYYDSKAILRDFCWKGFESGRCYAADHEKPRGEWNTLELICYGDKATHIVNGKVVMEVEQPRFFDGKSWIPMNKGKLQIQSEAAEVFYKNIKIKHIEEKEFNQIRNNAL